MWKMRRFVECIKHLTAWRKDGRYYYRSHAAVAAACARLRAVKSTRALKVVRGIGSATGSQDRRIIVLATVANTMHARPSKPFITSALLLHATTFTHLCHLHLICAQIYHSLQLFNLPRITTYTFIRFSYDFIILRYIIEKLNFFIRKI